MLGLGGHEETHAIFLCSDPIEYLRKEVKKRYELDIKNIAEKEGQEIVAVIRRDLRGEGMWRILQDTLILIIIAIVILFVSAIMEVYLIPQFF